jgi:FKBP-type peptidyl-prolyl cis-trans isomerase FklB
MDKVSYSLGVNLAESLKQQGFSINSYDDFVQAVQDVYNGEVKLQPQEIGEVLNNEFARVQQEVHEKRKAESEAFLAENAKREGVNVLPSGLQYEILKEGHGPKPTASDTVTTHYHGTLPDGKVFDSSVERGQPASFPVSGVIKGWVEALQLMPTGSKWRLYVPADLAYGAQGAGKDIGPHQALVFDVELLDIKR